MRWLIWFWCFMNTMPILGQEESVSNIIYWEQQASRRDEEMPEDFLEQGNALRVNINHDEVELLLERGWISAYQLQQLKQYRQVMGKLISVYELQAVPGWDAETFHRVKAHLHCSPQEKWDWHKITSTATQQLTIRWRTSLEKAHGYIPDENGEKKYVGSRDYVLMKYKWQAGKYLKWQMTLEKDPGEPLTLHKGMDFQTMSLEIGQIGKRISKLIVGDYAVNLGTGLLQWQSYQVGGGITELKPEAVVLKGYGGSAEYGFHRGIAMSGGVGKWDWYLFYSNVKRDATLQVGEQGEFVSAIRTTGWHRTLSERNNAHVLKHQAYGGSVHYNAKKWTAKLHTHHQHFSLPIIPTAQLYNKGYFHGERLIGYSGELIYYGKHFQLFGELASLNGALGGNVGIMTSLSSHLDVGMKYRNFSPQFDGIGNETFAMTSRGLDEESISMRLVLKANRKWNLDGGFDVGKIASLGFQTYAPNVLWQQRWLVQYKANRNTYFYLMYASNVRQRNDNTSTTLFRTDVENKKQWRVHAQWKIHSNITTQYRIETLKWQLGKQASEGFMFYMDARYQSLNNPLQVHARWTNFRTDDYASRIYAHESGVVTGNTISGFYGNGNQFSIQVHYPVLRRIKIAVHLMRLLYYDQYEIGSGNDLIAGNKRTRIGIQCTYQ